MLDGGVAEFVGNHREEALANAIAQERWIVVGGIVAPGLFAGAQVIAQFGASEGEKRANNFAGQLGVDSGEPANAGAAEHAEKNGFGLVVEGMGGRDSVYAAAADEIAKKIVAKRASRSLDAGARAEGRASIRATFRAEVRS